MFDWRKSTVQLLGRWQPWHEGHLALFKRALLKTGQVMIQVRDVEGVPSEVDEKANPFNYNQICFDIEKALATAGFTRGLEYEIMLVPNIVNITFGRNVGYAIEQESFSDDIESISATNIRKKLRENGELD